MRFRADGSAEPDFQSGWPFEVPGKAQNGKTNLIKICSYVDPNPSGDHRRRALGSPVPGATIG